MTPGDIVLSEAQLVSLADELDDIRTRVMADLGDADREYIYAVIRAQRACEVAGRALLYLPFFPPAWLAGVGALAVSKILDNAEIGHNVMHGQYDWMREKGLNSREFEWDHLTPSAHWRATHNVQHHTFTNVIGMDRDLGFGIMRVERAEPWRPYFLGNVAWALLATVLWDWAVAGYHLEFERVFSGERSWSDLEPERKAINAKMRKQVLKEFVVFPTLSGPFFVSTLAGNVGANVIRNFWLFSVIFCGHLPADVQTFSEDEIVEESRGHWYVRQMLGSANMNGSRLFHLMSGNLTYQIEHHLFPDMPARRLATISKDIEQICARYGLPYNKGRFGTQLWSAWRKIAKMSLPDKMLGHQDAIRFRVVKDQLAS